MFIPSQKPWNPATFSHTLHAFLMGCDEYNSNLDVMDQKIDKQFKYSLKEVVVFGIHEFSRQQINKGSAEEDKEKFKQMLLDAGCNEQDIRIMSLKDAALPTEVVSFLNERFNSR